MSDPYSVGKKICVATSAKRHRILTFRSSRARRPGEDSARFEGFQLQIRWKMRGKLSSRFLLCPTFRLSHDRSYCHNRTPANAGSRCGSNSGARRKCLEIRETVHARRPYQHSLETVEFLRRTRII